MSKAPTCKANRAAVTYDLRLNERQAIALYDVLGRIAGSYSGPRGILSAIREAMRDAEVPDINQPVHDVHSSIYYSGTDTRVHPNG